MADNFLDKLNETQREAVLHVDSPLLVVAGAGSGKTRVITHKIAHLVLDKGMSPHQVLGVTFTNKAAGEMKMRVEALTGIAARLFPVSTFHSLGLRLLRENGAALGYDVRWQVMDDDEQRRAVERLGKAALAQFTSEDRDSMMRRINQAKMRLLYPNNPDRLRDEGFEEHEIELFTLYFAFQQKNHLWDYEDLISLPVKMLQSNEEIRRRISHRFAYVLVDEFQDTNPNQYELVRQIASEHRRITAVGDDDQAIYSWRGADVRFLADFENDFPGARIIKLELNYRSTPQILTLANALITNNRQRRPKCMRADSADGAPVYLLRTRSKESEAESVARLARHLQAHHPDLLPLAVLYRINAQSLPLETELARRGIPFRIIKGLRFFDRKEVKDALALLRLALHAEDDLSFQRLVDCLPLGVGARTLEGLQALASQHGVALFEALRLHMNDKFSSRPLFARLRLLHETEQKPLLADMLRTLLNDSGYRRQLEEKGENERVLNLDELLSFIATWQTDNPTAPTSDLFDRMSVEAVRDENSEKHALVLLLTMHNAKGLEFPTVVVAGVNGAYLPFFLRRERAEIEEERRLFYVACTRAVKLLTISPGAERGSPFLGEIPWNLYQTAWSPEEIVPTSVEPAAFPPVAAKEEEDDGRFIEHPVFGRGRILEELATGKLLVDFTGRGHKVIDTTLVAVTYL